MNTKTFFLIIVFMILLGMIASSTELVFDDNDITITIITLSGNNTLWNVTGSDLHPRDATNNLKIQTLTDCDTIDTDGDGVFGCGTDATGDDPDKFLRENVSIILGGDDFNSSLLRIGNITNILLDAFKLENITGGENISISSDGVISINVSLGGGTDTQASTQEHINNITDFFGDTAINSSLLRSTNITFVNASSSPASGDISGSFTGGLTINTGAVQDDEIDYSAVTLADFTNDNLDLFILGNLTRYFGDDDFNSSVIRVTNITALNAGNVTLISQLDNDDNFITTITTNINESTLNNATIVRVNLSSIVGNINITGNFTLIGDINATGLSGIINCNQIDGGPDTDFCTDADSGSINTNDLDIVNQTQFDNITIIRVVNLTTLDTLDQYVQIGDFNLGNITNDTVSPSQVDNITILRVTNISNILLDAFKIGNLTNLNSTNISFVNGQLVINGSFGQGTVTAVTATSPVTSTEGNTPDIGLIVAKDIVAGTGLTGGEDNVLPGADADTTLSADFSILQALAGIFNLVNLTNFFGDDDFNSSVLRIGNITNILLDTFKNENGTALFVSLGDFNLGNISNYTQYTRSTDFNLDNITNDTIGSTEFDAATIVRLNQSVGQSGIVNITGNLTIVGNINATGLSGTINCNQLAGGSDGDFCADASGGGGVGLWGTNTTQITVNTSLTGGIINVNVPGNLSVGNTTKNNLSLNMGFNGTSFNFIFTNPDVLFNYTRNITFSRDIVVDGTIFGTVGSDPQPVKLGGINITNDVFSLTEDLNQSSRFTLQNLNNGSNASAVIEAINDMDASMFFGIGSSNFMLGDIGSPNITALVSRSKGDMIFANSFKEKFIWYNNPQDDNDLNNLVELMRLDDNRLNISTNLFVIGNVSMSRITSDVILETKLDIGVPGAAGGLDIGEGGSYTTAKNGTTIVQAFTYDASAASGSRFTELTLDTSNTFLGDTGDRFYVGSIFKFWAVRFEISRGKTDEPFILRYYDSNNLSNATYMGFLKDSAVSAGDDILNQTAEKEYITWNHEVEDTWNVSDNIDDLIPDGNENMYWIALEVPESGLNTAPIVTEIKVRGCDVDYVTGASYPVFWGCARIEKHERIALNVVKSPGATTTTDIDIDSAHQQTVFDFNGAGDLLSFFFTIPEGIDTSSPLHMELDFASNAADTYDLDISCSKLRNETAIGNSISPDFTQSTPVTTDVANTVYTGYLIADNIDISNMTSSDELSCEIQRTDGTNAMYPFSVIIHYILFSIGEIVTAD